MGLSSPLALLGLLAVSLPILAHVVRQRRLERQPFPAVTLLLRVMAARRRRVNMKDRLLLALRIACIATLALALAGPQLHLAGARTEVQDLVILLDDSMSMALDDSAPLTRALGAARARVEQLPEGSAVAIVLAGQPARVLVPLGTSATEAAARLEQAARSSTRSTDLEAAFELGRRELGRGRHTEQRLLVISDFNRESGATQVPWRDAQVAVEFANVAPDGARANRRLTRVTVSPGADSEAWTLHVSARGIREDSPVSLEAGGRVLARAVLSAGAGERSLTLRFEPPAGDELPASLHFDTADALPEDDSWPLWLRRQPAAAILIVDGSPDPTGQRGEASFLARALQAASGLGAPSFQVVDEAALRSRLPGGYQAVFLAGALPSPRAALALRHFVEAGGGLWVAPGPRLRSRALDRRLGPLLPARLSPARAAPSAPGLTLGEGAIGLRQADFAAVHLGRYLPLEQIDRGARVWLRSADSQPLLVEGTRGRGRVAVLGTSLGDRLGDLPYQPGYLPLVLKICQRLAERGASVPETVVAGTTVQLGRGRPGQRREVELPSGAVQPVTRDGTFGRTDSIGLYRVRSADSGEGTGVAFAVIAPSEEGDLSPDHPPDSIEESSSRHDTGRTPARPLAPWLYLLAGVLVALEGILRASRPPAFAGGVAR